MSDYKDHLLNATACWMDLQSLTQKYVAGELRGSSQEDLNEIRREAHDVLDAMLDHNGAAGRLSRPEHLAKR